MGIVIGLDDPGRAIGCDNMEQGKENVAPVGAQQPPQGQSVHYHYYGPQYPPPSYPQWYYSPRDYSPKPHRSSKPGIAGTLLIIAGIMSIILGASMGAFSLGVGPMWSMMDNGANNNNDLGTIQGSVIYMNSTPVQGANITIVDLGLMASTNASGQYRILNVAVGWHDIRVELPGYKSVIQSVDVTKGMMNMGNGGHDMQWQGYVTVDFQLQPGAGEIRYGDAHEPGPDASDWDTNGKAFMQNLGAICFFTGVLGGVFMFIGGVFAIKRRKLPWVITGCVFALIFSSILGIIAIILVLMSTNEFDRKKKREEDDDDDRDRRHGGQGDREHHRPVQEPRVDPNAPTTKAPDRVAPQYPGGQFQPMAYYQPYPAPNYYPRQY